MRKKGVVDAGRTAGRSLQLAGLAAAVVLAIVLNVLSARHFRRWDWTTGKLFTLSPATLTTLHGLQEPVQVWVLLGGGDPLEQSIKQLLLSYTAETERLDIHYIDPDRDFVALQDIRKRFNIDVDRTDQGRIVTDAIMVVARGDRHWFLLPGDMFEAAGEDTQAKPREEQAITGAIRNVLGGGEKVKICFTTGHGELSLQQMGPDGLRLFRDILEKNNYETVTVDTTEPNAYEPFKGCAVAILARPQGPLSKEEETRLRTYLLEGGSLLATVGPINGAGENGMSPPGIGEALAPFGIALDEDFVFEMAPRLAIPRTKNAQFVAALPKDHPVTAGLVPVDASHAPPRVVMSIARSLHHVQADATAVDLLLTSEEAFGRRSIAGAADWTDAPDKRPQDPGGPLVLAMASERAKVGPSAAHGPRVVVVGARSVMQEQDWSEPRATRGAAILVENAIAWLAAKPQILDVPAKAEVAAGIKISDAERSDVRNYVLLLLPGAVAFLGVAVALARRATERRPRAKEEKSKS